MIPIEKESYIIECCINSIPHYWIGFDAFEIKKSSSWRKDPLAAIQFADSKSAKIVCHNLLEGLGKVIKRDGEPDMTRKEFEEIEGKEDSFKEYKIQVDIIKNGYSEIQKGVYLWESEFITAEQTSWLDGDESKGMDFSIYPYWITTDSGEEPEGFDSIASALESLV